MDKFEKKISYKFKKKHFLKEALTHSSCACDGVCNQRMEFLGDSVLGVVTAHYLYKNLKSENEGDLTKLRSRVVCEDALYSYAKKIDLGMALRLGKGEEIAGGRERKSILADAFEAVIAAVYLDGGLKAAEDFIIPFLPNIDTLKKGKLITGDYKTALQEIIQKNPENKISYELAGEEGRAHNKTFAAVVKINGEIKGNGSGGSKKEAEQQAARIALTQMGYI